MITNDDEYLELAAEIHLLETTRRRLKNRVKALRRQERDYRIRCLGLDKVLEYEAKERGEI